MYEAKLLGKFNKEQYSLEFQAKDKAMTIAQQVDEISINHHCNFLAVGIHGRKKEGADMTICGSNTSGITTDPVCPLIIGKVLEERKDKPGGKYNWMACVDGSKESLKAIREALKLVDYTKDHIEVIHVKKFTITPESVKSMLDKFFEDNNFTNWKFTPLDWQASVPREDTILEYLHDFPDETVDFFVISNHGTGLGKHTGKYIGRVAKGMLEKAKANVILSI